MIEDGTHHWDGDRQQYIVYAEDYDKVVARLAVLQKAIDDHNEARKTHCLIRGERGRCEAYTSRGRRCPDCPHHEMIEVPA